MENSELLIVRCVSAAEEKQVIEKVAVNGNGNGNSHEEHAAEANGESKAAEQNGHGDELHTTEKSADATPASNETVSKPKRSGSRVKDFFAHIFKRGNKTETPKKEKVKKDKCCKKEKCDESQKENGTTDGAAVEENGDTAKHESDEKAKENGHEEKANDCHGEKGCDEKLGAEENRCVEQVGGEADKRNDEKRDC